MQYIVLHILSVKNHRMRAVGLTLENVCDLWCWVSVARSVEVTVVAVFGRVGAVLIAKLVWSVTCSSVSAGCSPHSVTISDGSSPTAHAPSGALLSPIWEIGANKVTNAKAKGNQQCSLRREISFRTHSTHNVCGGDTVTRGRTVLLSAGGVSLALGRPHLPLWSRSIGLKMIFFLWIW